MRKPAPKQMRALKYYSQLQMPKLYQEREIIKEYNIKKKLFQR